MPAKVSYSTIRGNTVPYPPLFDEIRRNHGYIETRGKPENIALIPEAEMSEALNLLLLDIAEDASAIASLGCDLGDKRLPKTQLSKRWTAGGYVQIVAKEDDEQGETVLRPLARNIHRLVEDVAAARHWEIEFSLCPVLLKFADEEETRSIWMWFHANASTRAKALQSREELLLVVRDAVGEFQANWSRGLARK